MISSIMMTPIINGNSVNYFPRAPLNQIAKITGNLIENTLIETFLSELIHDFVGSHPHYNDFIREMFTNDFTTILEFCSPNIKSVVPHLNNSLVLTGIRNNVTGRL